MAPKSLPVVKVALRDVEVNEDRTLAPPRLPDAKLKFVMGPEKPVKFIVNEPGPAPAVLPKKVNTT